MSSTNAALPSPGPSSSNQTLDELKGGYGCAEVWEYLSGGVTRMRTTNSGETQYRSVTPRLITPDRVKSGVSDDISMADRCAYCRRLKEEYPVYDGKDVHVCMESMDTLPWE